MEQDEHAQKLHFLRHGISNFLAGIFFLVLGFQFPTNRIDVISAQRTSWTVGGVLILAAFSVIIAVFPVREGYKGWIERWEARRLSPILYTISMIQLAINFALFYVNNSVLLLTITGIFLLFVLAAVIYMLKKWNILKDIPRLMLATLAFNVLSVTLIFNNANKWQIIPYALIGISLLLVTIWRYAKVHMQSSEQ